MAQGPRAEYPRPAFQRSAASWVSLNGSQWEYAVRKEAEEPPDAWDGHITVPFCLQSPLSGASVPPRLRPPLAKGLGKREALWYRLELPSVAKEWRRDGSRVLLHIGACDFSARVFVNAAAFPEHIGGSTPFSHDISDALGDVGAGSDVVLLCCQDRPPSDAAGELLPCGKQTGRNFSGSGPHLGTVYSNVSGIWQSVWLERVATRTHLAGVQAVPLPPSGLVGASHRPGAAGKAAGAGAADAAERRQWGVALYPRLAPGGLAAAPGGALYFEATLLSCRGSRGRPLATRRLRLGDASGGGPSAAGLTLNVPASATRMWTPEDPHLYGIRYRLCCKGEVLDEALSYVGLRTVTCEQDQVFLNGQPIYLRMVLDQGYYPDGLWTAPRKESLWRDIDLAMRLGFNGARLHQKVFEPWYFHYADLMGFLVVAEYPDWPGDKTRRWKLPEGYVRLVQEEWPRVVEALHNHPSLIMWTLLNEMGPSGGWEHNRGMGGGFRNYADAATRRRCIQEHQDFVKALCGAVRKADLQRRLVHDVSGWIHVPSARPDVWSFHDYTQDAGRFEKVLADLPARHVEGRKGQPLLVTEYGGVGMEDGGPCGRNPKSFLAGYRGGFTASQGAEVLNKVAALTSAIYRTGEVAGFCYTQLYDIEWEKNGLLRYDRRPKRGLSLAALRRTFGGELQAGRWAGVSAAGRWAAQRRRARAALLAARAGPPRVTAGAKRLAVRLRLRPAPAARVRPPVAKRPAAKRPRAA